MKFSIDGGVEVDILSGDEYRDGIQRLLKGGKDRSIRTTAFASGNMPSSGSLLLNFGGPQTGTMWVPLAVTFGGPDDHTVVANSTAAIYMGGQASANPSLGYLLIPGNAANTIPHWVQIGGKDSLYMHFGDHIYALIYGAAAGTNITATLRYRMVVPSQVEELNML
jgi:hypothetical protein